MIHMRGVGESTEHTEPTVCGLRVFKAHVSLVVERNECPSCQVKWRADMAKLAALEEARGD